MRRKIVVDVGQQLNPAFGARVSCSIPLRYKIHALLLTIWGSIDCTVGGLDVIHEDGIARLIRRIEVSADGHSPIRSLSGETLEKRNRLLGGVLPGSNVGALVPGADFWRIAATDFVLQLKIPFEELMYLRKPEFFSLRSWLFRTLDLTIQYGLAGDLVALGVATDDEVLLGPGGAGVPVVQLALDVDDQPSYNEPTA